MFRALLIGFFVAGAGDAVARDQETDPMISAPENQAPRIEPEPRWNPDVIRAYLKEQNTAYAPIPEPTTVLPVAKPAPLAAPISALAWDSAAPDFVIAKLGSPTLDRRDGRIRMLQFARGGCVLDVMLSRRADATDFGVRSLAARTRVGGSIGALECLNDQLGARKQARISLAAIKPAPTQPAQPDPVQSPAAMISVPLLTAGPASVTPPPPALVPGLSYPLGGVEQPQ